MSRARRSDPSTSHAAARSVTGLRLRQQAVLNVFVLLRHLTDEEMIAAYYDATLRNPDAYPRQTASGLRTRRSELVRAGYLLDTYCRRKTAAGRPSTVWGIAPVPPGEQMNLDDVLSCIPADA